MNAPAPVSNPTPNRTWIELKTFSGLPDGKRIYLVGMGGYAFSSFDKDPTQKTTQELYLKIQETYTDWISAQWEPMEGKNLNRKVFLLKGGKEALIFVDQLKKEKSIIELELDPVDLKEEKNPYRKVCEYIVERLCFYRLPEMPGNEPTLAATSDENLFIDIMSSASSPTDANLMAKLDWPIYNNNSEPMKVEKKEQ